MIIEWSLMAGLNAFDLFSDKSSQEIKQIPVANSHLDPFCAVLSGFSVTSAVLSWFDLFLVI